MTATLGGKRLRNSGVDEVLEPQAAHVVHARVHNFCLASMATELSLISEKAHSEGCHGGASPTCDSPGTLYASAGLYPCIRFILRQGKKKYLT
jgi:hypothetical protein